MSAGYQTVKTFDCKSFGTDYEFDYFNVKRNCAFIFYFFLKIWLLCILKTLTKIGHLK